MGNQVTEDTKTPEKNTSSGFLTWTKDVAQIVIAVVIGGTAIVGIADWFVDSRVEVVRGEFVRAIRKNGERLAVMETELKAASSRLDGLNVRVTDNTKLITDLRLVGGPDQKMEGSPGR